MAKRNLSATIQIGAKIAPSVASSFAGLRSKIDALGSSADKLKKASSDVEKLAKATAKLDRSRSALGAARKSGDSAAIDKARTAFEKQSAAVEKLRNSLKAAGVDTRNLSDANESLARSLTSVQTKMQGFARLGSQIDGLKNRFNGFRSSLGNFGSSFAGLTSKVGVGLGVIGYAFKTQLLDPAAEFESLEATLKVLEGSSEKAKKSMDWISDFAAETPSNLLEVTNAFKQLKSYGLDPIEGDLLKTLGDTAAAMNKPIQQAVEAIADALTGENERLKEFGIKSSTVKGKTTYSYLDKQGKEQRKTVDANNKQMIKSTLAAIWNSKYAGAMEEQMKTWNGMMSNIGDQWTRFKNMIMASGLFDWMKGEAKAFLDQINAMAKDGSLKRWAEQTGVAIKGFFIDVKTLTIEATKAVVAVKEFAGGWQNLGIALGSIVLAPTITSLVQLGAAVAGLLGPWGLLAAGVFTGVTALIAYREEITGWLQQHPVLMAAIQSALGPISNLYLQWQQIADAIDVASTAVVNFINALAGIPDMQFGGVPIAQMGSAEGIGRALVGKGAELMAPQDMPEPGAPVGAAAGAGKATRVSTADTYNITVNAPGADAAGIAGKLPSYLKAKPLSDTTTNMGPK